MDKYLLAWPSQSLMSRSILRLCFIWALSFTTAGTLSAQSCACEDQVNVQLDDDCQFTVSISAVQAGNCTGFTVIVNDDNPSNGNIVDCAGLWDYGIFDTNDEFVCWGRILAEDKRGPVVVSNTREVTEIECNYIDLIQNNPNTINPNSKYYIGQVLFEDNCSACGCDVDRKFFDNINFVDCNDNGTVAVMTRTWTATDCQGNETVETQTFNFVRPSLSDLQFVDDQTIQTCDAPPASAVPQFYPFWVDAFGDNLFLNDVDCNYSTTVSESQFDVCAGSSYKLERSIRVLDWCSGQSSEIDSYIVKVGDFEGPQFTGCAQEYDGNAFSYLTNNVDRDDFLAADAQDKLPTVRTVGSSCSASMFIDQNSLESLLDFDITDCGNVDISVSIFTYGPIIRFGFPQGPDVWQQTNYPMINGVASGIPVGLHAIAIEATDNCKSASSAYILFRVKDTTPPIMRCDDQLNISVTTGNPFVNNLGAYARVDAIDVDEGSSDNCELDRLLVRRSVDDLAACEGSFIALGYDANNDDQIDENDWFDENNNGVFDPDSEFRWEFVNGVWMTPWREFAEFFCCDVDQSVTIELGGWDKAEDPLTGMAMPNFSFCWLDVLIEDKIEPILSDLPDMTLNCDDLDLDLLQEGTYTEATTPNELEAIRARFGSVLVSGTECGSTTLTEVITRSIDERCPEGFITREITVDKATGKGNSSSTVTQTIFVNMRHDYSICFPADVTVDCDDGLPNVPGVTFSEGNCDLFAALTPVDEVFTTGPVGPDNGCYKIFRTYKIINWCEYDGISQPIIVSRDWDGDNNTNPKNPDGDDLPGDEGICVIVKRNFLDNLPDTTYYDRDTDPTNNIPGNDPSVSPNTQGYWWRVISGSNDPNDPDYYDGPVDNDSNGSISAGEESVWRNDANDNGSRDDDDFVYGSNGYWEYTQHIKVFDQTPPQITVVGADEFCSTNNIDCSGDVLFTVSATDNCTPVENLRYTVQLDVNNDGFDLINVTSALVNGTFTARYPIGKHRLIFTVEDDCGEMAGTEEVEFDIVDCLAPSPICSPKLTINLSPDDDASKIASLEIWASDFTNTSPVGDCTGQGPEMVDVDGVMRPQINKYSINRKGEPYDPDADGLEVTCADAGQLVPVEVHAIDEAGNHAFCNTFIEVQDNNNLCSSGATEAEIAGIISTPEGKMMEEVEVQLSGQTSMMYMTNANGEFIFESLDVGHDYTVRPSKDIDHRNGVSIVDLLQIKKHVLNYESFNSPHQLIAADVDNSGRVTVKDMIDVQRLILHKIDRFEGNTSWRFIDEKYVFNNPTDPFGTPYPESININNLSRNTTTNFTAIKVGDPNGSAESLKPRSVTQPLEIKTEERALSAGETYTFYLKADLKDFQGFQFTAALNESVEIVDVTPALLSAEELGIFTKQGMITAAWSDLAQAPSQEQELFGITVRAKHAVELSKVISINSRMAPAESVSDLDKGTGTVVLQVGKTNVSATEDFALFNNQPNPFNNFTNIRFQLPAASQVNIQISDVSGRVIQTINQNFDAGEHQIQLTNKQFPAAGIYYLSMTAGEFTANQKLIFVN